MLSECRQSRPSNGLITESGSGGEEPRAAAALLAVCSAARRGCERERERMGRELEDEGSALVARQGMPVIRVF